jgi:hypothetical protein
MTTTSKAAPTLDTGITQSRESPATPKTPLRKLPRNQALLRLQRKCSCDGAGSCESCSPAKNPEIQTKVPIGPRDDAFEREADATADRIMRMSAPGALRHVEAPPQVQRAGGEEEEEKIEQGPVQRKPAGSATPEASVTAGNLGRGGRPLPSLVKSFFESRFGRDFSSVKIHTGKDAETANRDLHSYAFTYGPHIWLGQGQQVAPNALLAHELTHVVQQTEPPPFVALDRAGAEEDLEPIEERYRIQRHPGPQSDSLPSNVLRTDFNNGFVLVQTPALGRGTLYYQDRVWVNFKWDARTELDERKLKVDILTNLEAAIPRVTLKVDANFRVELQVNQGTEQFMTDFAAVTINNRGGKMEVAIEAGGSGDLNTFPAQPGPARSEPLPAKTLARYTPSPGAENRPIFVEGESERTPPPSLAPAGDLPAAPLTTQQQIWIQKDQNAFERFARNHPDTNWAAVTLPDGRVAAFALTESLLQRAADRVRARDYRFPFQSSFPGSHVTGIVLHGKILDSVNDLENLYYDEDWSAAAGIQGDFEEAEVFTMAGKSFGRKPLTHAQAAARWAELDAMPAALRGRLETQPGGKFYMLWARGVSDTHRLDLDHFNARDRLLALPAQSPGWDLDDRDPMLNVLKIEADRPNVSGAIREFLEKNEPTAKTLQEKIVQGIETTATQIALRSLRSAMNPFDRVVKSDADAELYLLTLAAVSEEQRKRMLTEIGYGSLAGGVRIIAFDTKTAGSGLGATYSMSEEFKRTARVTGSRDQVIRLILGETVEDVSLKAIRSRVRSTRDEYQRTIDSLSDPLKPKVKVLYHEGDLGEAIRAETYRALGFQNLKARDYPHTSQTKGLFPGPMAPGTFSTIAEQMFANFTARHQNIEDLKLAAEIVASMVTIILSEGLGTAVAAEWFAGSAAVRTVVSGITFTVLEAGLDAALTGTSPIDPNDIGGSLAKFGGQVVINIATFAFFKQLDSVLGAFSRRGVRTVFRLSERGFAESTLAKGTANLVRLSGLSAFFINMSFTQYAIAHNGQPPSAREAARMALKSVVSIAVMETAGSLTKSMTREGGFWSRAEALNLKTTERNNLIERIRRVNNDLVATKLEPDQLNASSEALAARYESLLNEQKRLLNDLKPEVEKRGDPAAGVGTATEELARIEGSLDALHQAKLVASARLSPAGDPATAADATEFTYTDTPASRQAIIDQFGAAKVKVDADGVIHVTRGDGVQVVIRPAPPQAEPATTAPDPTGAKPTEQQEQKGTQTTESGGKDQPDPTATVAAGQPANLLSAPKTADFFARRTALVVRRFSLLRRALATRLLDAIPEFGPGSARARPMTNDELRQRINAQNAVLGIQSRRPGLIQTEKGLAGQEAEVTAAEKAAGPELDRLADLAFSRHKQRLEKAGLSFDRVRTGALSKLTDRQIGEALAEVPGAQGLNEAQLRGILFAAYGEGAADIIDIRRLMDMAGSAAERNAVLEWFAKLMDQSIPGTREVLQTMTTTRNNWRGGLHVLDFAVNGTGGTRVIAFEFPEAISEINGESEIERLRIYDIILSDGTRIQCKNWRRWFSVRSQFQRDVRIQTDNFASPTRLQRIRWIFRGPSPKPASEIRAIMRDALEDLMTQEKLSDDRRAALRDAFNSHTDLVTEWSGTSFSSVPAVPVVTPGAVQP